MSRTASPRVTRFAVAATIVLAIAGAWYANSFSSDVARSDLECFAVFRANPRPGDAHVEDEAARTLAEVECFYTAKQIGYAMVRAPIADPLEVLERSNRRIGFATRVAERGTPAGSLYGLLLLRHSDPVRFAEAERIALERHGDVVVTLTDGCTFGRRRYSDLLQSIRFGSLDFGICAECAANRGSRR